METKVHETPFDQSKLHSNIGVAPHLCIALEKVASKSASVWRRSKSQDAQLKKHEMNFPFVLLLFFAD